MGVRTCTIIGNCRRHIRRPSSRNSYKSHFFPPPCFTPNPLFPNNPFNSICSCNGDYPNIYRFYTLHLPRSPGRRYRPYAPSSPPVPNKRSRSQGFNPNTNRIDNRSAFPNSGLSNILSFPRNGISFYTKNAWILPAVNHSFLVI